MIFTIMDAFVEYILYALCVRTIPEGFDFRTTSNHDENSKIFIMLEKKRVVRAF